MAVISVIVPVYKVEAYLDRCVKSVLEQSFVDFELILVDDGSPDRSGELCDGWAEKDSRIRVIHQENGGLSAARNAGIDWMFEHSDSQWVTFLDSDDWIHRDFLRVLYDAVTETGCRLSVCGLYRTEGEARKVPLPFTWEKMTADGYYCGSLVGESASAVACGKLYHRSLFEQLRYPVGKLHEDEFTTYRAVYAAETVAVVPQALYAYYQNPQSITRSQWNPRRLHVLEAFEQQMAFALANGKDHLRHKVAEQYIFAVHDHMVQIRSIPEHRGYLKMLRKKMRWGLTQARKCGLFPFVARYHWVYEDAWPCKPFWWLLSKVR